MLMITLTNPKLLLFHFYASCYFLFSYHVVAGADASPFSFSFDFSKGYTRGLDDLLFEGNAGLNGGLVDLTCNSSAAKPIGNCTGRLAYRAVPFYTTTGIVASFSTRFSFVIRVVNISGDGVGKGDAMTFFLSRYPLANYSKGIKPIVAVQFDTIGNASDPSSGHLGININSVQTSVNTTSLPNLNGSMTASITFTSSTRMLVASLHFDDNPSGGSYQVSTQLTNPVTDLLPSVVAVGFSAATGANIELHQIMSWSFNSTINWPTYIDPPGKGGTIIIVLCTFGLVGLMLFMIWIPVATYKNKHHADSIVKGVGDLAKRFEYRDLAIATDQFSKSRELGQGAFGVVYEGNLKDQDGQHHQVAVKKIKGSNGDFQDFLAELKTISETRHKNLVSLKGWCSRKGSNLIEFMCWWMQSVEFFLVYELVPNGNLDVHLNEKEEVLPWAMRYNIVKDIGSALRYLHHESNNCILHRDIKPGNILLDEQFNAKLADFGLSRIAHTKNEVVLTTPMEMLPGAFNANAVVLTHAIGTRAYMDPRCMKDGIVRFDRSSDVYSFGIVLLEIACTKKSRVEVWDLYKSNPENMAAAADARLNGDFDVAQMQHVAVLGLWCSFLDVARRPSMVQAMDVLEHDAILPNLMEYEHGVAGSEGNI